MIPPGTRPPREDLRKIVHVLFGLFAVSLRFLPPAGGVALAAAALAHNHFLFPRYAGALLRPSDRSLLGGIRAYPAAVLALVLVFLRRPELAAAAWGTLAFGDGLASLVGRKLPGPRLPWNPRKTLAGTAAYFLGGAAGAAWLLAFVSGRAGSVALTPAEVLLPAALAAAAAAAVESLPLRLDDNWTAAFAAAVVLAAWTAVDPAALGARGPELAARALPALPAVALLAGLAWRARTVDLSGAIGGFALGAAVWILAGAAAFVLLGTFFVLGSAATRYGRAEKEERGLAQERGGRRSFRHAFANGGVGAGMAFLSAASPVPEPFRLALAGAFATAAFDTASSEIGQVLGRRAVSVTNGRAVPVGTEGAVSREGTAAGLAAAAVIAGLGAALGLFPAGRAWIVVAAAAAGGFVESLVGATLGRRGLLGNETMNLLNTAVGAAVCLAFGLAMES